jgi:hypothetical protein
LGTQARFTSGSEQGDLLAVCFEREHDIAAGFVPVPDGTQKRRRTISSDPDNPDMNIGEKRFAIGLRHRQFAHGQ